MATGQRGGPRPIDDPNTLNADGSDGSDIGAYEADPTLRFTGIQKVGGDFRLTLTSMYGLTYGVQSADDLAGFWVLLPNNVPGTGSPWQALDAGGADLPKRFYRATMELLP